MSSANSDTDVANLALLAIGVKDMLGSLYDTTPQGRACARLYRPTLESMLAAAPWGFARKSTALTLREATPPAPWHFEYERPADCVFIRQVQTAASLPGDYWPYAQGSVNGAPVIHTDVAGAVLTYNAMVEAPSLWSPAFLDAMTSALASRLALSVSGSISIARNQAQMALNSLAEARAQSANEGLVRVPHRVSWLEARDNDVLFPNGYGGSIMWANPTFLKV